MWYLAGNPEDRFSHNEARYTFIISDQTVDVQADLPLSVNIIGLSGLAFMCFFSLMLLCVTQCMETIQQYLKFSEIDVVTWKLQ